MNIAAFYRDLNKKKLLWTAAIILTFFFFYSYSTELFNWFIRKLYLDKVKSEASISTYFVLVFLSLPFYWIYQIRVKKLEPTIDSLVLILLLSFAYFGLIKNNDGVQLTPFNKTCFHYADVLFFLSLTILTKFKRYKCGFPYNNKGFREDSYTSSELDVFDRNSYAVRVGEKILYTSNDTAFVIAINSPWGFGKTTFLTMLRNFLECKKEELFEKLSLIRGTEPDSDELNYLQKVQKELIVFEYNPWKNFEKKVLIEDFFNEFASQIAPYSSSLSLNMRAYSRDLTKLSEAELVKMFDGLINILFSDKTISDHHREINDTLKHLGKKIIIIIDDLDRLVGSELVEVLKLIRNTANFSNTFFIIACDHNYVLNSIDKQNLISSKEEFLQKIIQLEITLPTYNRNVLITYFLDRLKEDGLSSDELKEMSDAMNELLSRYIESDLLHKDDEEDLFELFNSNRLKEDSLFFNLVTNIRDIKRFSNSFKLSYDAVGKFCDKHDLLLLELIKVRYLSIYQLLSTKSFVKVKDGKYEFKSEQLESKLKDQELARLNIRISDLPVIVACLKHLFNSQRKRYFRSVVYPKYFDMYFRFQAPDLFSLEKYEKAFDEGIDEVIKVVDTASDERKLEDLITFLENQSDFVSRQEFEKQIYTLMYLSKYVPRTEVLAKDLLRNKSLINKLYESEKDSESFESFVYLLLKDIRIPIRKRAEVAYDYLYILINREREQVADEEVLLKNKTVLQDIIFSCLEQFMLSITDVNDELIRLYMNNLETIEGKTRKIHITDKANQIMNEFIRNHPYNYFKKYFLRYYYTPPGNVFTFDPFIDDIMGGWNVVRDFLNSELLTNQYNNTDEEKTFLNILRRRFDLFAKNNYQEFEINDKIELNIIKSFIGR